MDSQWIQTLLAWIEQHPGWAGLLVWLVAFTESLALVGILVPGIFILFGVGTLIGLYRLDFIAIWAWASSGALLGDLLSYWLGYHYREGLKNMWPFRKYPDGLDRAQNFIRNHGQKSVLMGRFVGPLRPVVPVTAGMLGMSPRRFLTIDISASILWGPAYLLPGILFGATLDVTSEYTARLAWIAAVSVALIWFALWLVRLVYEWLAHRSARIMRHSIRWSRRHPVMGRVVRAVLEPGRPEMLSLATLGLTLVVSLWALIVLLLLTPFQGAPLAIDQWLADLAVTTRSERVDPLMILISQLGQWPGLLVISLTTLLWVSILKRYKAASHWILAVAGGAVLQLFLAWTLSHTPILASRPDSAGSIPSAAMVPATVVFGFFAVMVSRDMQRRHRRWPYLLTAGLLLAFSIARLYLGVDKASTLLTGFLLGGCWTAAVGIAYRQRVSQVFSPGLTILVFCLGVLLALAWNSQRLPAPESYRIPISQSQTTMNDWWQSGWQALPGQRSRFGSLASQTFNLQIAGYLPDIHTSLATAGWQSGISRRGLWLFQALNPRANGDNLPLPTRDYRGRGENLRLHQFNRDRTVARSIRLWDSGLRLEDGQVVWLGQLIDEFISQRLKLIRYWKAEPVAQPALAELESILKLWESQSRADGPMLLFRPLNHPETGVVPSAEVSDVATDH